MKRASIWLIPLFAFGFLAICCLIPPINFQHKRQPRHIQAVNSITHVEFPIVYLNTNVLTNK